MYTSTSLEIRVHILCIHCVHIMCGRRFEWCTVYTLCVSVCTTTRVQLKTLFLIKWTFFLLIQFIFFLLSYTLFVVYYAHYSIRSLDSSSYFRILVHTPSLRIQISLLRFATTHTRSNASIIVGKKKMKVLEKFLFLLF